MDYQKFIESLENNLTRTLDEITEAKTLEEKVQLSTIIKNLSNSLSIFSTIPGSGYQADDIDEDDEAEINDAIDDTFL